MSSIAIAGDTSGSITLSAPATAGTNTITLPAATGNVSVNTAIATVSLSGTSQDVTGIPSWAKEIEIVVNSFSLSGTAVGRLQLGTASGVETTGYSGTVTRQGSASNFYGALSAGIDLAESEAAADLRTGRLSLLLVNSTSNLWLITGITAAGTNNSTYVVGTKSLSGVLDRLRFTSTNGTDAIDGGSVTFYIKG